MLKGKHFSEFGIKGLEIFPKRESVKLIFPHLLEELLRSLDFLHLFRKHRIILNVWRKFKDKAEQYIQSIASNIHNFSISQVLYFLE